MTRRSALVTWFAGAVVVLVAGLASPAGAQVMQGSQPALSGSTSPRRWEVEVHGGFDTASNPAFGTSRLPPPGASFVLADGVTSSRLVSSWYFGDGAKLFNQVSDLRGIPPGTPLCGLSRCAPHISALDTALLSATVGRGSGGSLGVRVTRHLSPRLSAEAILDVGLGQLAFVRAALSDIELSRASVVTAFTGVNNSSVTLQPNPAIDSTATIVDRVGTQMVAIGAVTYALSHGGPNEPYVLFGGGMLRDQGTTPSAHLVADYHLTGAGGEPYHSTDTVTLRHESRPTALLALGGGVKHDFSPRSGLRIEGRFTVAVNRMNSLLDATPVSATGAPAGVSVLDTTNPGLQFSSVSGIPSNLSGPPITGFVAFTGSGPRMQATLSVGYFRRF